MTDQHTPQDPTEQYRGPEEETEQKIEYPGATSDMEQKPDHGEDTYVGSGKLDGKRAVITGGDSGDIETEDHCQEIVDRAVAELGGIDILVNNAAYQMAQRNGIFDITSEQLDRVMKTNIYAMFWLTEAALAHMAEGSSIINTASIQGYQPSPQLLDHATTKAGILNFTRGLAQQLTEKGIRVNAVAQGPIWTPLIPATMAEGKVEQFGAETPTGRAGQPAELAPAFVFFASQESSYISGERLGVTGGKPLS